MHVFPVFTVDIGVWARQKQAKAGRGLKLFVHQHEVSRSKRCHSFDPSSVAG